MSFCKTGSLIRQTLLAVSALLVCLPGWSQYPGQISKDAKASPELRSIAVLEWTGQPGKPKASRLVPVAVLDAGRLEDGGIYLARPQPLALGSEIEYELEENGKPIGLYDIRNAGEQQGSWVGFGIWKPMPMPKPSRDAQKSPKIDDVETDDHPVLHRKHPSGDSSKGSSTGSATDSGSNAPAADPDRPTLHKKDSTQSTSDTSSTAPSDPDRPTLHKKTSDDSADNGSGSAQATDPDRPVLKKSRKTESADVGDVESVPNATDPDRPRLKRGVFTEDHLAVTPSLVGIPTETDLEQTVAVSDAKNHPEHMWNYAWANPDDEAKMKSSLEDMARAALGLKPPAPPVRKRTTAATSTRKPTKPALPPPPIPLSGEQFRVFELAYGSGATLVLTAHTDGPVAQQKFVTIVAQPDLYGNVLVLLKSVTDGAHLDEKPRMRLVDAVDAMADNRGELLFELRGATQRQFALYRVLRGQAEKLFVSGGADLAIESRN
jgi:hypothetical protein